MIHAAYLQIAVVTFPNRHWSVGQHVTSISFSFLGKYKSMANLIHLQLISAQSE